MAGDAPAVPEGAAPTTGVGAPVALSPNDLRFRRQLFYSTFVALVVLYAILVLPIVAGEQYWFVSLTAIQAIVAVAPQIGQDVSVLGDVIPALLGAMIAASAPATASNRQLLQVLAVAAITYALYLHMSVVFSPDGLKLPITDIGEDSSFPFEMTISNLSPEGEDGVTLQSLASGGRNFAMFVFAGVIGIKFSDMRFVAIPFRGAKPAQAAAELDPAVPPQDERDGATSAPANG